MMTRDEYAEDMIDRFLKNSRNLASLLIRITERAMAETDIVSIDERNCRRLELTEKINFFGNELKKNHVKDDEIKRIIELVFRNQPVDSDQVDAGTLNEIKTKMEEIKKIRIGEALNHLQSFRKSSFNLDREGYDWSKFYENEEDEPETEKFYRESITDEMRRDFRRKGIYLFISNIYIYLGAILRRDLAFLIDHLNELIKNDEFTSRISIIFGSRNEDGKISSSYATEEEIDRVWKIVQGCVKNGIYYCHATGVTQFKVKVKSGNEFVKKPVDVLYENLAEKWNLEYQEYL